jgi:hypothetical protein
MSQPKKSQQTNVHSPSEVLAAVACADAFLRVAEPLLAEIPALPESTQTHSFSPGMGEVAAAATNLGFAMELYIKSILFVCNVKLPQGRDGHDLAKLYTVLPPSFRVVFEDLYTNIRRKDWGGKYPSITFATGPAKLPKWVDHSESFDLEPLLIRSSNIFTSWRYVYEFKKPQPDGYRYERFEYALLVSACRAMRDTINSLQNPVGVASAAPQQIQ